MGSPDRRIEQLVNEFVRKVTAFAQDVAVRVLVEGRADTNPARNHRKPASRRRRSARARVGLDARVLAYVAHHLGARVADINAELGTITQEIARSIRALIGAKKLRAAGVTRSTRYFPINTAPAKGVRKVRGAVASLSRRTRTRRSPARSRNARARKG